MTLIPVPGSQVASVWSNISDHVAIVADMQASHRTADQWRQRCEAEAAQLWLVADQNTCTGAVITEVFDSPRGKTCLIAVGVGDMAGEAAIFETLTPWAKEAGCVRFEIVGREGWARQLAHRGFRKIATVIAAEI